jgi:23S rRNA pseudoU1915 N3-methylase RlmH
MADGHSEGRPCGQSDNVAVEDAVAGIEMRDSGTETIRDTAEIANLDRGLKGCPSTRKPPLLTQRETSDFGPPVILRHLQDFFNNMMKENKKLLQSSVTSVEQKMNEYKELLQSSVTSVEQKMKENNELLQSSVEQMKEGNNQFIEEFRRENKVQVEQSPLETQTITLNFSEGLQAETPKLAHQVSELQCDAEEELTAVQGKLQGLSLEVDTRIVQQPISNLEVRSEVGMIDKVERLSDDIESVKVDRMKHTEDIGKRQGESLAPLHKDAQNEKSGNQR